MEKLLNFNIGILGHVDSGKTSLAKVLSSVASTAAFDKNPQSQNRGITIDLGFSAFTVEPPEHIAKGGFTHLQFTLVDCPGHASLIRTIIGGAQIINSMILVIDITKGMQVQTAECLVVGEILCKNMIVVLNKIDLIDEIKRKEVIEKMTKKIFNTLKNTKFNNAKIVSVSADPTNSKPINIESLIQCLKDMCFVPKRAEDDPFVFSVDHCFLIKGQGTVITGTILQGTVNLNDSIEIPSLKVTKKVKSIQMFRQPVKMALQGDRVGICVTQLDSKLLERSIIGYPGYIKCALGFIAAVHKIDYYKQPINSKSRFHISLGHDTILSKVTFFGSDIELCNNNFDFDMEYPFQNELLNLKKLDEHDSYNPVCQFALVEFDKLLPLRTQVQFVASKLDMDIHTTMCRIAFWGNILFPLLENYKEDVFPKLKVFKNKMYEGKIERMNNDSELITKNLLKKETDINAFIGLKVELSSGEKARIEGFFGQSGKVKLALTSDLLPETKLGLLSISESKKRSKKNNATSNEEGNSTTKDFSVNVQLKFKKYVFNPSKKLVQT